jgi:hypothetical protein
MLSASPLAAVPLAPMPRDLALQIVARPVQPSAVVARACEAVMLQPDHWTTFDRARLLLASIQIEAARP